MFNQPDSPDVEIHHPLSWTVEFSMEVDLALDTLARASKVRYVVLFFNYSESSEQ